MPSSRRVHPLVEAGQPLLQAVLDPAEPVVELRPRTAGEVPDEQADERDGENDDGGDGKHEGRPP